MDGWINTDHILNLTFVRLLSSSSRTTYPNLSRLILFPTKEILNKQKNPAVGRGDYDSLTRNLLEYLINVSCFGLSKCFSGLFWDQGTGRSSSYIPLKRDCSQQNPLVTQQTDETTFHHDVLQQQCSGYHL